MTALLRREGNLEGTKQGSLTRSHKDMQQGWNERSRDSFTWKGEEEEIEGSPGEDGARLKLYPSSDDRVIWLMAESQARQAGRDEPTGRSCHSPQPG